MKNKQKGEWHRLRYEEMQVLAEKFDNSNFTCGFLREPFYNPRTNQVKGFCYFMKDQKVDMDCKRKLPFKAEGCVYYERWRESKLEKIK